MKPFESVCITKSDPLSKKAGRTALIILEVVLITAFCSCWFLPRGPDPEIPEEETYNVSYSGNGADSGSVPIDETLYKIDETALVLGNTGDLVCGDCIFAGWNTDPLGNGTAYNEGNELTVSGNTTLYAVWEEPAPPLYSVIYVSNENTGGAVPSDPLTYLDGQQAEVKGNENDLVKNGRSFICWNTEADGSGTDYHEGDLIQISGGDAVLYAVWDLVAGSVYKYPTPFIDIDLIYVPAKSVYKIDPDVQAPDSEILNLTEPALVSCFEVPEGLWRLVEEWAEARETNLYELSSAKQGYSWEHGIPNDRHPATDVDWAVVIVWMNALTEYYNETYGTNMRCVYYTGSSLTTPIRTGLNHNAVPNPPHGSAMNPYIDSTADGFRMPKIEEYHLILRYIGDFNSDGDITDPGEYYPDDYATGSDMPLDTTDGTVDFDQDGDIDPAIDLAHIGIPAYISTTGSYGEIMQLKPTPLGFYDMTGNCAELSMTAEYDGSNPMYYYFSTCVYYAYSYAPLNLLVPRHLESTNTFISFRIAKNFSE